MPRPSCVATLREERDDIVASERGRRNGRSEPLPPSDQGRFVLVRSRELLDLECYLTNSFLEPFASCDELVNCSVRVRCR